MRAMLRWLADANAGALAAVAIIFAALVIGGANSAARAALLAAALLAALAVACAAARRRDLVAVLSSNWISILAAMIFLIWSLLRAAPSQWTGLASHPLWDLSNSAAAAPSMSPYRSIEGAVSFLGPCAAFLLGAFAAPGRLARDWVARWLIAFGLGYALFSLALFISAPAHLGRRLDGGLSSANAAATAFAILLLIATTMVVRAAKGKLSARTPVRLPPMLRWAGFAFRAPLSFGLLVLAFACLLLTASRGGLVATVAASGCFALLVASADFKQPETRRSALWGPMAAIAVLLPLLFLRGGDALVRRFALASDEFESRRQLAEAHWNAFLQSPLYGHGLNSYYELNTLAATPENLAALSSAGAVHNIFIQAAEETGVVGLVLFALMLAPPLLRALSRIARGAGGAEWAAAAFSIAVLALGHGMVDFGLQVPAIAALFAFTLGAFIGRPLRARQASQTE